MRAVAVFSILIAAVSCGCSAQPGTANVGTCDRVLAWAQSHGGTVAGPVLDRVQTAAGPVLACVAGREVSVAVLDSDAVTAYGWPDGRVFISRGLVDRLTDAELAAVVAHEAGHLQADGHLHANDAAALAGRRGCSATEVEITADVLGMDLLERADLPADAMLTLLEKVAASHAATPAARSAFASRIAAVRERLNRPGGERTSEP